MKFAIFSQYRNLCIDVARNTEIHALDMALGVICRRNIVVNLDFVCNRPSHMHRCRAFLVALAGFSLF